MCRKHLKSRQLLKPFKLLWETLERLNPRELPGIALDAIGFENGLPVATSAVYFLMRQGRILYIGRAANLRGRWRVNYFIMDPPADIHWAACHHRLKQSLELGGVMLHWWALPKKYLGVAESVLIQIHKPPWNNHRG